MVDTDADPWNRWYEAYRERRAALRKAALERRERRRAANVFVGLLLAYMLLGGVIAGIAVGCVMAN